MGNNSSPSSAHESCSGCGEVMDVTNFAPFDRVLCPHCQTQSRVKTAFGNYRLIRRHAVGGMSVIFVGQDMTLDREVAIKVLNEDFCNDRTRIEAFESEARLTAQVNHPNVINVYAVGHSYGRFYLVMELLGGESFESLMKRKGALPEAEVLKTGLEVASGLKAAKTAGVIHRDVKPANILLDTDGRARLVDFGLALITQDGRAQAEEVWATPYYVPPEALERGIEDFRSDLYAFGATLYHALAGRPSFESTSTENKVLRRAKQVIPRLGKVAPSVSPATCELVDRLMSFKSSDRPGSYDDVISHLRSARRNLTDEDSPIAIASSGPSTPSVAGLRKKRRNSQGPMIASICIGAFLLLILAIWQPWKTSESIEETPPIVADPGKTKSNGKFNPGGPGDPLVRSWQKARREIGDGKFSTAEKTFLKLSEERRLPLKSRAWAMLEGSVASSLNGNPGDARSHANMLWEYAKKNLSREKDLQSLSKNLQQVPPVDSNQIPASPKSIEGWMAQFSLSVKLWEQGLWEQSLPHFANVRSASLPEEFRWFEVYQQIADTYLADGQILRELKSQPDPDDVKQVEAHLSKLRNKSDELQTKGRANFNLRAQITRFARQRRNLLKSQ